MAGGRQQQRICGTHHAVCEGLIRIVGVGYELVYDNADEHDKYLRTATKGSVLATKLVEHKAKAVSYPGCGGDVHQLDNVFLKALLGIGHVVKRLVEVELLQPQPHLKESQDKNLLGLLCSVTDRPAISCVPTAQPPDPQTLHTRQLSMADNTCRKIVRMSLKLTVSFHSGRKQHCKRQPPAISMHCSCTDTRNTRTRARTRGWRKVGRMANETHNETACTPAAELTDTLILKQQLEFILST